MENLYNMNNNNYFYKLGTIIGITSMSGDIKNPEFQINELEHNTYNDKHIEMQKKFASILVSIFDAFSPENKSAAYCHIRKIASEDNVNWNVHCDEVLENCVDVLQENNIDSKEFSKIASAAEIALRTGMLPLSLGIQSAGMLIPATGALGGSLSWLAEKELTEDDAKTEVLKAKIREYQRLTAELERRLIDKYGYKSESK